MRCGHRHVRARRLAYFADGLCVATPVQSAAAASGRARRPPRPRQLRHDWQARRRRHGHEDLAAGTPAGSLPLGPCGAKPVPVSRARSSSRLRPVGARLDPLTIECGLVIGAKTAKANIHTGAASRHGSTTSTPPARCQPTLIRVALTYIYTAHTHVTACHAEPASTPPPVPQLTRFSCLRAALARQDLLVARGGRRDPWFVLPAS